MNDGGLLCTAVLSPLSPSAALLSLLRPDPPEHRLFPTSETSPAPPEHSSTGLPDAVSSVLGVLDDIMDGEEPDPEKALNQLSRNGC